MYTTLKTCAQLESFRRAAAIISRDTKYRLKNRFYSENYDEDCELE